MKWKRLLEFQCLLLAIIFSTQISRAQNFDRIADNNQNPVLLIRENILRLEQERSLNIAAQANSGLTRAQLTALQSRKMQIDTELAGQHAQERLLVGNQRN